MRVSQGLYKGLDFNLYLARFGDLNTLGRHRVESFEFPNHLMRCSSLGFRRWGFGFRV